MERVKILAIKDRRNGRYTVDYIVYAPCFCSYERFFMPFEKCKKAPTDKEIKKAIIAKHGNIY